MTEHCWVLTGAFDEQLATWVVTLDRHVSGEPARVEADWQWAMAREEEAGDLVGFAHTHPPGAGKSPSYQDIGTMQAWCSALAKPLLCLIDEGTDIENPVATLFQNDQDSGSEISAFRFHE